MEAQVPLEIAAEVLGRGVLHPLVQPHHLHILGHHIHDQIGGQALGAVGEPLDEVGVGQGRHPHRAALVVDLGEVLPNLELGDHVRQFAKLAGGQALGGILIHHGDLVVGDLLHLGGEIAVLHSQELGVAAGPQHHPRGKGSDGNGSDEGHQHKKGNGALLFHEPEVACGPLTLEPGGKHRRDAVHGAQQEYKHIELLGVEVQGGQLHIEVPQAEEQRHTQVDEHPGKGIADGLSGLAGLFRLLLEGGTAPLTLEISREIPGIKAAEMERKRHETMSSFL